MIPPQISSARIRNLSAGSLGEHKPRLADIQEGIVAEDVTPPSLFFGTANSHSAVPPTPYTAITPFDSIPQGETETQRTLRTMSNVSMAYDPSPTAPGPTIDSPHGGAPVFAAAVSVSVTERKLQSCPASIHTTPIPAYMSLQQAGVELTNTDHTYSMAATSPLTQSGSLGLIHIDTVQTQIDAQNRINTAHQAVDYQMTPNSAGSTRSAPPLHNSFDLARYGPRDSWPMPARWSDTVAPSHIVGREYQMEPATPLWPAQLQAAMGGTLTFAHFDPGASIQEVPMPLTIDPRWVSPRTSTNTTPAQTPGLQFSNPFENVPVYVSPVEPAPQQLMRGEERFEHMQVDRSVQRHDHLAMSIQPVCEPFTRMGTQSYPPGQGGRKRMEVSPSSLYT